MADTAVAITAGTGTNIDTRTEATNGNHRQVVVLGDPSTNAGVAPVDATKGLAVDLSATGANTTAVKVNVASGGIASGGIASGAVASGAIASGALASGSIADGASVTLGAKADAKSTATDTTAITFMQVAKQISASIQSVNTATGTTAFTRAAGSSDSNTLRVTVDSGQLGALGQAVMASSQPVAVASNQTWPTGMSPRAFSATFTTLTRPANTTLYTAADSISDNATAGSVTALSATVSDTNDDPITITEILVSSTDTGLAGKKLRAYLFNSNPTSNSGVGGGDNAAFSQKVAGYIGSFQGWMETGFSDGTVGRLVPTFNETNYSPAGGFIVALPTSGAKTLYIQYQAVEGFTPSANSTTIIGKAKGYQGRAA